MPCDRGGFPVGCRPGSEFTAEGIEHTESVLPKTSRKQKKNRKDAVSPKPDRSHPVQDESGKKAWWIPAVALVLILFAYANATRGEFVYDDSKQIVQNYLIQDGQYFWSALTKDVWAFKGERQEPRSNYWRPVFVLWLMLNFRLFGLDPTGWHWLNLILHAAVCLLLWQIFLRFRITTAVIAAVVWLFAVHPVHVESVTWISGSTDLLLALFAAASLYFYIRARSSARVPWMAYVCYALALLSKESVILFPGVIFVVCLTYYKDQARIAAKETIGFIAVAAVFLVVRGSILHGISRVSPWAPDYASTLLTVPLLLAFYLFISVFPVSLGPSYSLRAVHPADLGLMNFLLPVAVLVAIGLLAVRTMKRKEDEGKFVAAGLSLFFFLILPALYIRAFLPDQIVHDRYMYLPVAGILLFGFSLISRQVPSRAILAGAAVACIPLTILTARYNVSYQNEQAFWQHAVITDPTSATNWSSLGNLLRTQNRPSEARAALSRCIEIDPNNTLGVYGLAMVNMNEGRFDEAESGFRKILQVFPDHESATDQLAVLLQRKNRVQELILLMENARKRMPFLKVKYTGNLAFAYVNAGNVDRALAELESIQGDLNNERDPKNLECWFYLADLYRIKGRNNDAVRAAQRYLESTRTLDPGAARLRSQAESLIRNLQSQ